MAVYEIGNYIHDLRIERGYSQEELSFGICSIGNLSKIERGSRMPNRKTVEALMQRLGCGEMFLQYSSREEMYQAQLCSQIVQKLAEGELEGLESLIAQFEQTIKEDDLLNRQYCRFAKVMIGKKKGINREAVVTELERVIQMTKPMYQEGVVPEGLLTYNEIVILINIANMYDEIQERTKALHILFKLKNYMETHIIDENERMKKYPLVIFNLTNMLLDEKRYGEVIELCDSGLNLCKKNNRLRLFPKLLLNKGFALLELGEKAQAENSLKKSVNMLDALEEQDQCEKIVNYINNNYKIKLF